MAKGKYQCWLDPDGFVLLEGWAKDGLPDEQSGGGSALIVGVLG